MPVSGNNKKSQLSNPTRSGLHRPFHQSATQASLLPPSAAPKLARKSVRALYRHQPLWTQSAKIPTDSIGHGE